jgi:SAM-dependent methyltransferase
VSIAERILFALSRNPSSEGQQIEAASSGNPLALLEREYPDLRELVAGKHVLDFGCGEGRQAAALAAKYRSHVVGFDTNVKTLQIAMQRKSDRVDFTTRLDPGRRFDVVVSQDAMEHFTNPAAAIEAMTNALAPGGKILMTFGPPWYAPYGSHMYFFCRLPWINLLFPERAVMNVRAHYRSDGARRYEEVESGLNRMTLRKFERIIEKSGLKVERLRYHCIKGLDFLSEIPLVRELTCNHVTAILARPCSAQDRI